MYFTHIIESKNCWTVGYDIQNWKDSNLDKIIISFVSVNVNDTFVTTITYKE